jgi:hypothetical protein
MSDRKSRRETDKAIKHLMAYTGPNGEWEGRFEQVQRDLLNPLADKLEVSLEEMEGFFLSGPFHHMVIGFAFEEFATVLWDNQKRNLIDAYLEHRGWREGPAGRRYLQALGDSELQFWEITAVKPGSYAELRPYGTADKSIRVKEKAATESLHQWDGLVARVLHIGGSHVFSGAMLPFSPDLAARIQSVLSAIPEQTRQLVQELIEQGGMEASPDNLEEMIRFTQESELAGVSFLIWAVDVYVQSMRPSPALRNMDDEPIELTGVRFPFCADRAMVARALDASPVLHREADTTNWSWFPKPYDDIDFGERVSLLGHIRLGDDYLELESNSVARAKRGRTLLASLLGDLVGPPLTVHDNMALMNDSSETLEPLSEVPPEVQEAITAQLTSHYRKTLDEPIPMLNGLSPRQCAADPALQDEVVGWLKSLENSTERSPGQGYDFSWMWDELNLTRS